MDFGPACLQTFNAPAFRQNRIIAFSTCSKATKGACGNAIVVAVRAKRVATPAAHVFIGVAFKSHDEWNCAFKARCVNVGMTALRGCIVLHTLYLL